MTKKQLHLVIVTGMSGAGKTVAIQSFEDLGYFTIDNMPPALLPKFLQLVETKDDDHKLALVVDMRSRSFFSEIQAVLDELENQDDLDFKILFWMQQIRNWWHAIRKQEEAILWQQMVVSWTESSWNANSWHP